MKRLQKYRIKIEDESRLSDIVNISLSRRALIFASVALFCIFLILSGIVIMVTPLRTLLPGYLKQSERAATEESLLRLDSILMVYQQNQRFIDNYLRAFDTSRLPDTILKTKVTEIRDLPADSLIPASALESSFVKTMAEREKFNISVLAPLAANSMMFTSIVDKGLFTPTSRRSEVGEILVVPNEPVRSPADGRVLTSYYSASENGFVVIIQHAKGFVTRLSGLVSPTVATGDQLIAGQVVALSAQADKRNRRVVEVMIWHNAIPVIPFDYVGKPETNIIKEDSYEAPRGR